MPIFAPMALLTSLYVESMLYRLADKIEKTFLWAFTAIFAVIGISAVPVYSSIQGIYPWIRGTNLFPSTVLLSLLIVPSSVSAMWFLWSKNFGKYWVTTIIPIVVGMVFTAVAVAPVVDIHKSFVPFCHELMAIVPSSEPLYAYSADETLRGAVPFYTGRYLTEICGPGNLEKTIETKGQVFIITRDKKRKAETELLSTGKLSIIFQQKMGGERTLTLLGKNSHTVQSDIHLAKDN